MERTLSPNDYILVNKFLYGSKIPIYACDIPVVGSLFISNRGDDFNLYTPLKAFEKFSRENIVVFKSTESNTKFLVKRIIGLPGDTLQIKNTNTYVNSILLTQSVNFCYDYIEESKHEFEIYQNLSNSEYNDLNIEEKSKLKKKIQNSTSHSYNIFPISKQTEWTQDNYGAIIIPKKGCGIVMTYMNYDFYKSIIKNYEKIDFQLDYGEKRNYIFKNNYYFMMGDNRHNSIDSRSYGFVPECNIQGKMMLKF
tara:strand:+ start:12864 stop:13619 length:756 start_codon:yes stop_codon:yes gene_type:complete